MAPDISTEVKYYQPGKHPEGTRFQTGKFNHLLVVECPIANLGTLHFSRRSNPCPHGYLELLHVPIDHRQMGFAKMLLNSFNEYLTRNSLPGLLRNDIPEDNPAHSIYESNGWKASPQHPAWFYFNVSDSQSESLYKMIEKTLKRLTSSKP